ncbi:hypothetical protein Tco_0252937 [Tanacetum coccineum]
MITKFIKFVELNFPVITRGSDIKVCMLKGPSRKVLSAGEDFCSFLSRITNIDFLESSRSTRANLGLAYLLSQQGTESRMVRIHIWLLDKTRLWPEFLERYHSGSILFVLGLAPTANYLASYLISKGSPNRVQLELEAYVNFLLRVSNASMHFLSEKIKRSFFFKERWQEDRKKSTINESSSMKLPWFSQSYREDCNHNFGSCPVALNTPKRHADDRQNSAKAVQ